MPLSDRVRYYPAFPPAVPQRGVGCIRVTHPCATLDAPKGALPSDLHVLGLPLAFILSQDQTLLCTIVLTFSFLCSIGPALVHVYAFCLYLHGTASLRPPMDLSCWLLKLSKNPRLRSAPSCLSPLSSAGAKVELFPIRNTLPQGFFRLFCTFSASSPQHAVRQTTTNSCRKTFSRNFSHKN